MGERRIVFFYNKVFREEAVARRSRPEPLDDRLQVTAPHEWMVLAGLALSLLAFLAWGVFGSVDRRLAARAVLVQPGERHAVVSPVSGNVIEVLADVGDPLEAGQAIARVRLPEAERQARITRGLVGAVEDGMWHADGAPATFQEALLAAARNALGEVETLAGETIAAPHGGKLVAHRLVPGQPVRAGETIAQLRGGSEGAWQALAFVSPRDAGKLAAGMAAEVQVALPRTAGFEHVGRPGAGGLPTARRRPRMAGRLRPFDTRSLAPAAPGAGRSAAPAARRRRGRCRADRAGEAVPRGPAAGGRGRLTPAAVAVACEKPAVAPSFPCGPGRRGNFPEPRQGTDRTAGVMKP